MRDNEWLKEELAGLIKKYFANVTLTNPLEIRFGREAKYRFGSIRLYRERRFRGFRGLRRRIRSGVIPQKSIITITSMFAKEDVPAKVVQYTIAHEFCHYLHGFSSTNRRLFKYPHHGGIVNKELTLRGAEELIHAFKKWLKVYRKKILKEKVDLSM